VSALVIREDGTRVNLGIADHLVEHTFQVPLDHERPDGEHIEVFAREVSLSPDRPWLVYLQGGPGGKAPRPTDVSGWLGRAVRDFRVLLLDQRGTGRSSPINRQTLPLHGDPPAQARYLRHFRADSIVRDCELIRAALVGEDGTWSVLGQSFGGFCATTYLSLAPRRLSRVLITGGLPPLSGGAEDVYRLTYPKMLRRNERFRALYPDEAAVLARVRDHVATTETRLPGGDLLTPERLQYLGLGLGMVGGYENVRYLLEEAWIRPGALSDTFLAGVESATSLTDNPLFAALHEAAYCQGTASLWAASRVLEEHPEFAATGTPFLFTGEMIYPWMFESYAALRPMREAAELIAQDADWPALYDAERLAANEVPVAAVIYHDDMYVARESSTRTADAIRGARVWITNEYEHDGLRRDGANILDRLLSMA
jgi:pimeloyl-ACP methyl ester carboxylesterase